MSLFVLFSWGRVTYVYRIGLDNVQTGWDPEETAFCVTGSHMLIVSVLPTLIRGNYRPRTENNPEIYILLDSKLITAPNTQFTQ